MMRRALAAAGVGLLGAAAIACAGGNGGSLPDAAPCPSPTPSPSATSTRAVASGFLYYRTVERGAERLDELLDDFRADWPDNTFYRNGEFRTQFVEYAGEAGCVIDYLQTLASPGQGDFVEFAATANVILTEYETTLASGLDAIRTRNTSEYRDFARDVDALEARIEAALRSADQ